MTALLEYPDPDGSIIEYLDLILQTVSIPKVGGHTPRVSTAYGTSQHWFPHYL